MPNPFTTNYSRRETAELLLAMSVIFAFLSVAVVLTLDYYIAPLLDGWVIVLEYIMLGDDSFFNQTVQTEVDSFVDRSKEELLSTQWKNMTDSQIRDKLQLMINTGTQDIFDKLYSIILVLVAPVLTIPLVVWLVIKITTKITTRFIKFTGLVDDEKEFLLYFKGRQIMGKPTTQNSNI